MNIKNYIKTILLGAGLLLAALPAEAQNIIRPKIAGPNGLWVNSYNGVLFFGQTDMETQNSQMPMQLRFYYNSSAQSTNYGYGLGFSLGFEMRYRVNEIGGVVIETGDGRTDTFKKFGNDFEAPAGVFSKVEEYESGKFRLTEKSGEQYFFDDAKHGKVTSMTDRNGNKTTFTYQDSMLVKVQDAVGHVLNFSYVDGMLRKATASFHKGSISYEYDGLHRLKKRIDAMGNITLYGYDKQNRICEITDANGHKTLIAYNGSGMVSRMKTDVSDKSIRYENDKTVFIDYTAPKNQYSYYRWDEKGRVVEKVGLCCGIQSTLEYDDDDNVVKRTDANGNITSYTYDDRGNMLSLTDALGNSERYTYDDKFNLVTSFQDKNGNSYRFDYDAKGNLKSLSGPLGFSNSFTYNDKGWPLNTTDANNNVTATTYNANGTAEKVMNAAGYITSYSYDECGNILSMTDGRSNTTSYTYDSNNQIISQTDALGHTSTLSYDKVGNIVRVKNAKNQIRAYSYDALGNVLTMTDPMGGVYTYKYDGKGNVLSVTDPMGNEQTFAWNEKNKLTSQTNAAGEKTGYDYDAKGNLVSVFQPNGNTISYFYDKLDRIEQLSDNMGVIAKYTYDGNGNQLTMTDGLDRTMTYTYDGLNRKTSESLPSGATTRYQYDNNSNLTSVTDALSHVTSYTYSSLNQQLTHTDALNAVTKFEYDANGNLSKATDAKGNATSYAYDALNQNTTITFANGASLQYTYDELGNVISSKDRAGNEFKYAYNPLGNLLSKTYPDGTTDKYTYDRISRMLSAVNKDASVTFTYDKANRLLTETLNGKTTSYSYHVAAGKRTLTYPSGMKVEERLNARDLIASILQNGNEVVTMEYNVAGQKTKQTYANGITTDYGYNENGWLSAIKDDHKVLSLAMSYDAIGNMTKRADNLDASRTESYGYDVISQLTSFTRGKTVNKTYQFDLLGNRVKTVENGVFTNYTSNNVNAYTAISGGMSFTPSYDGNGNMLNDDKHQYVYDYNSKMASVGDKYVTYKYDALGRRIAKNNTLFYYVGDQMVEESTDGTVTSYLYGNNIDEALQMSRKDEAFYYHTNHLGSTMGLTNKEGKIVEKVEYDVYGMPTFLDANGNVLEVSSVGNNILFTGREYNAETGDYYFRARSLHPMVGRFMQKDPLMYVDGMNNYLYAKNIPTVYTDPSGEVIPLIIIGGVLIGANIGAWSTWFECGTFSPSNSSFGKAGYGAIKGGLLVGSSLINPWLGLLTSANFTGWEGVAEGKSTGNIASDMLIDAAANYAGMRIGSSALSTPKKMLAEGLVDFYSNYVNNLVNAGFSNSSVDWQSLANQSLYKALTNSAQSHLITSWENGVKKGTLQLSRKPTHHDAAREILTRRKWNPLSGTF